MENPHSILKKVFGYDGFRPGQEQIVSRLLAGQDVLAVMPTGAGKSICYQVPALLLPGITIVVSPLVSLMKDQVGALVQAGVAAAFLNNSLTDNQKALMLRRAREGWYKIIYVAPERLEMPGFQRFAQEREISMVTVDEAHCISQWGQDFRPSYLRIKEFVETLPKRPVIGAFTATATAHVRDDIRSHLDLHDPYEVITSFDRPNLYFGTRRALPSEKPRVLLDLVLKERDNAGIIYCSTTKQVDETTRLLQSRGIRAKNNEPQNWEKTKRIMFAKDYVRHCLTGDYVTDYIEAEGSMMFDINKMEWSEELCGILDIDTEMMPKLVRPADIVGRVTSEAAKLSGLAEGTPVLCGTTDTVMEVFAAGAVSKGQMTLKLATAGRICVITDRPYPDTNLINYSHITDGLFYPGTATKSCAASYRWFRDTFGGDYRELDMLAEKVPIGADGLIFHPYLNGELTPYANPNLCADFVGVRASHTKAHFTRAVLEGVAMSMLDCMRTLENINIPHNDSAVIIGGGGKSPLWRQMTSDALNLRLVEMKYADSSFGSAMLAGVSAGVFESCRKAVEICNEIVSQTIPNLENTEKYHVVFNKYKAVQKALENIYNGEY